MGASAGSNPPRQNFEVADQEGPLMKPPDDYLYLNIFACLCCCFPLGIAGIIVSTECREAAEKGDKKEANRKSKCAQELAAAALAFGFFAIVGGATTLVFYVGLL